MEIIENDLQKWTNLKFQLAIEVEFERTTSEGEQQTDIVQNSSRVIMKLFFTMEKQMIKLMMQIKR